MKRFIKKLQQRRKVTKASSRIPLMEADDQSTLVSDFDPFPTLKNDDIDAAASAMQQPVPFRRSRTGGTSTIRELVMAADGRSLHSAGTHNSKARSVRSSTSTTGFSSSGCSTTHTEMTEGYVDELPLKVMITIKHENKPKKGVSEQDVPEELTKKLMSPKFSIKPKPKPQKKETPLVKKKKEVPRSPLLMNTTNAGNATSSAFSGSGETTVMPDGKKKDRYTPATYKDEPSVFSYWAFDSKCSDNDSKSAAYRKSAITADDSILDGDDHEDDDTLGSMESFETYSSRWTGSGFYSQETDTYATESFMSFSTYGGGHREDPSMFRVMDEVVEGWTSKCGDVTACGVRLYSPRRRRGRRGRSRSRSRSRSLSTRRHHSR